MPAWLARSSAVNAHIGRSDRRLKGPHRACQKKRAPKDPLKAQLTVPGGDAQETIDSMTLSAWREGT